MWRDKKRKRLQKKKLKISELMTKFSAFIVSAMLLLAQASSAMGETRWGDFTLGTATAGDVRQILTGRHARILEEGGFASTQGTYILAMAIPGDTHALSSKFIFDQSDKLVGIFSKYPGEMFAFARDNFGKLYRIAWVEYGAQAYPPEAQDMAKAGGYELVITDSGEHAIVYDAHEFILRLVAKDEGFAQVEIMLKKAIGL